MKIYQVVLKYQKKGILNEKILKPSYSEGTSQEDITELEDLFDIAKNNDDIKEDDIVNTYEEYAFIKLSSGRYCLCKVITADGYKDKFMCHAFILDEGYFTFYPSEAINSPSFFSENSDIENAKLSVLESISLSGEYSLRVVSDHVKEKTFKPLRETLKSVLDYAQNMKNIVIVERSKEIPFVISAVQMAFPVQNAHNITFSTVQLNGSDRQTMIKFINDISDMPALQRASSRIYNFRNGLIPIGTKNYKFLRVVETGYFVSVNILTAFNKYMSQYDYRDINAKIEDAYDLFVMTSSDSEIFTAAEVEKAFKFALENSSMDMLEYLFEKLEPAMNRIIKMADFDGIKLIIDFLFKISNNCDMPVLTQAVNRVAINVIDYVALDKKDTAISYAYELYDYAREKMSENPHTFLKYSIEKERINYVNIQLNLEPDYDKALFYIDSILKAFAELGYAWPQVISIENIEMFFDTCIKQLASGGLSSESILKTASVNSDIFAHFTIMFFNRVQSDEEISAFAEVFVKILKDIEPEAKSAIRKRVNELGGGRLLFEEYKILLDELLDCNSIEDEHTSEELEKSTDTANEQNTAAIENTQDVQEKKLPSEDDRQKVLINFFADYCREVFSVILEYYKNYFSDATKLYVSRLTGENKYSECIRLITEINNNGIMADDAAAGELIRGFEEGVKLGSMDAELEKSFNEVKKLKKTRSISSYPDISAMIDFVIWLKQNKNTNYSIEEILSEQLDLDKLDDVRYYNFIEWCLPEMLDFSKTAEDHKQIIHFYQRGSQQKFLGEYIKIIADIIAADKEKGMKILQGFVVYFFFYLEPTSKLLGEEETSEYIRKLIIDIFNSYPKSFLKEFDSLIKKEFARRGLSLPIQWPQTVKQINAAPEQSGLLNKFSKIFKK